MSEQTPNLHEHPDIVQCDERIRQKQDALNRAKESLSEEARRKASIVAVQQEEARLAAAKEERTQTVARVRAEAVAEMRPAFDFAAREVRALTVKAAEVHARLADIWERARQANGGRPPFPQLHMLALLPSTPKNGTPFSAWLKQIDKYVETPPAPRKRKRLATSKSKTTRKRK